VPSAMAGRPSDESVIARFGSKVADRVYKPIPGASFGDPLAFASRQTATRRTENILEVLSSRPKLRSLQLSRIALKTKGTILFIDSFDVIAIEAKGNHLLLLHASGPYLLRESITTAEKKLNRHGFVRIQRSVLINPMFVHELKSWSAGRYVLRIKGGRNIRSHATTRGTYSCSLSHGLAQTVLVPRKSHPFCREFIGHRVHSFCESTEISKSGQLSCDGPLDNRARDAF